MKHGSILWLELKGSVERENIHKHARKWLKSLVSDGNYKCALKLLVTHVPIVFYFVTM